MRCEGLMIARPFLHEDKNIESVNKKKERKREGKFQTFLATELQSQNEQTR